MFWHRFSFWLFTLMIPFISFIGYLNYMQGKTLMLALNVFTVIISAFNVYTANKSIKRIKKMQQDEIWHILGGKINEI